MRAIDADKMLDDITAAEKHRGMGAVIAGTLRRYIMRQPTLTPPNEWVSVEERLPEPGERVLAAKGTFVGEAYLASNGAWMRHDGFPWEVDAWMPLPAPPGKGNNVPTNEPLTIEDILGEEYELEEIKKVIQCKDCEHMWAVSALPGECYCRLRGEVVPKDGYCHRGRAALKAREPDA